MSKLVCGVGFNDKTRPAKVDGKKVKEYQLWQSMLERCFGERLQPQLFVIFLDKQVAFTIVVFPHSQLHSQ